jgi:hypothetical protein
VSCGSQTAAEGRSDVHAHAAAYDFFGIHTLTDVGGGNGNLIAAILKANLTMHGVIFELPYILDVARGLLDGQRLTERCDVVAGDFFTSVPCGGDAYILRAIVHDWDDARAGVILKNCLRAMQGQGKLLLVERVMPERAEHAPQVVLEDLEMLVMSGGRERTEAEFQALFDTAGFELTNVVPTQYEVSIIEGVPV